MNHDFKRVWTEEWRKHQPFNQMPYMLDNETGYSIYESRAIAKCEFAYLPSVPTSWSRRPS